MASDPSATSKDKNPKGGLSPAGRKKFGVKAGVKSYSSASDADKRRWVSWALRFTATPQPLKDDAGKPTRYALMFTAWGEPVPTSAGSVRAVHAKAITRRKALGMGADAKKESAGARSLTALIDEVRARPRENARQHGAPGLGVDPAGQVQPQVQPQPLARKALVTDNAETARTYITVPIEPAALCADDFLLHLSGRLVQGEKANANGAYWSATDLAFGVKSVALGPLNWLHEERRIIGVLTRADLVETREAAAAGVGPHIAAAAQVWRSIFPAESKVIESAAAGGDLYYSMECVAQAIECVGPAGCGQVSPYLEAMRRTEKACEHVRAGTATRRFVNPIFQGAAVIVPPVKPGWAGAHLEVMDAGAKLMARDAEAAAMVGGSEVLAAQFASWVGQGR